MDKKDFKSWKLWLNPNFLPPIEGSWVFAKGSTEAFDLVCRYGLPTFMDLTYRLGEFDDVMNFLYLLQYAYLPKMKSMPIPCGRNIRSPNLVERSRVNEWFSGWWEMFRKEEKIFQFAKGKNCDEFFNNYKKINIQIDKWDIKNPPQKYFNDEISAKKSPSFFRDGGHTPHHVNVVYSKGDDWLDSDDLDTMLDKPLIDVLSSARRLKWANAKIDELTKERQKLLDENKSLADVAFGFLCQSDEMRRQVDQLKAENQRLTKENQNLRTDVSVLQVLASAHFYD